MTAMSSKAELRLRKPQQTGCGTATMLAALCLVTAGAAHVGMYAQAAVVDFMTPARYARHLPASGHQASNPGPATVASINFN